MALKRKLFLLYGVFALSGFSGLIYESIWSHYLKLFLGHAAYAQALVLVTFMGGMALGAWLISKFIHKIPNLFIAYALVEVVIGCFGLAFHSVFQHMVDFSYDTVFVYLDSEPLIYGYQWLVASLLILPQSLLLGMTFPLMSNGLVKLFPKSSGRHIATLYFCNSIGAAIGVLISGFYLIGKVGLPGALTTASLCNILLAIVVYGIVKRLHTTVVPSQQKTIATKHWPRLFLAAAFVTGAASFIYEIAWIRMLSMVLGSSTHAFELMISAFITGLALGAIWVRKYLDKWKNPIRIAGGIQIGMGLLALATIPLYNYTFDLMSFFVTALQGNENGYVLFNVFSHFIVLLVMLPTTFCAGMTLPLFTVLLLKNDYGERSIGHVYASNTLGAIVGVIFAVFIGMPSLGLKGVMLVGASLDIALGIVLFMSVIGLNQLKLREPAIISVVVSVILLLGVGSFTHFDVKRMASAVYRHGQSTFEAEVLAHFDGSTASISVMEQQDQYITILTNGKPDATIAMGEAIPASDEYTMILTAALPLAIHQSASTVANIGFGSGQTTHTLLLSNTVARVDNIEIEPFMLEGAKLFKGRNDLAFADPRSHINIGDAKTYFRSNNKKYDIIISEPSNPWVSGISSLFTTEFYQTITQSLHDDGIFVQWLHSYESNIGLIGSILQAISANFSDYHIYAADTANLVIIASPDKTVGPLGPAIFAEEKMRAQLARVNVNNMHDLSIRFLGSKKIFAPYLRVNNFSINSDFFPVVDLQAAKVRFTRGFAEELHSMRLYFVPILHFLDQSIDMQLQQSATLARFLPVSYRAVEAQQIYNFVIDPRGESSAEGFKPSLSNINYLLSLAQHCQIVANEELWIEALFDLNMKTVAYLDSVHIQEIYNNITGSCGREMSDIVEDLLALYIAYGTKNIDSVVTYSTKLLQNEKNIGRKEELVFLSSSLLLGLVILERYQEASGVWEHAIAELFPEADSIPFPLQILGSILLSNINKNKAMTISK